MSEVRQRYAGRIEKSPQLKEWLKDVDSGVEKAKRTTLSSPTPSSLLVFLPLLAVRLAAAIYSTIPDCDEVYNYWEPAHYLLHNAGFQTWEYSPVYAIRSWAYIALHSLAIWNSTFVRKALTTLASIAGVNLPAILSSKQAEFYALRIGFAVVCAAAETRLYSALARGLGISVARTFVAMSVVSAGMFHASTAFLPSTFAMYTGMLGAAEWLDGNTVLSLTWFATGAVLGWPFAAALALPFITVDVLKAPQGALQRTVKSYAIATGVVAVVIAAIVGFDTVAYRKLVVVPLNIVLYNVFGGEGKGPDIYGTEPWWFYLANLALNFNVLLPLALGSIVVLPIATLLQKRGVPTKALTVSTPFFVWFAIFTLQPHKEERFMFPAYPFLLINASIALNCLPSILSFLPALLLTLPPLLISALISLSRVLHILTSFSAPLNIYSHLPPTSTDQTLCLGKEWYRFPSSFHLPSNITPAFIASSFRGLLPGKFPPSATRAGSWMVPEGMNELNQYDPGKVVDISVCDYLVDLGLPSTEKENPEEPDYSKVINWRQVHCERWLDVNHLTWKAWNRRFWYPGRNERVEGWGNYCLLKRVLPETDRSSTLTIENGLYEVHLTPKTQSEETPAATGAEV